MQLCICFLDERHPELLGVGTVSVQRSFGCNVVGDTGVDLYELPETIFEKSKYCKAKFDSIMEYQV